MRSSPSSSPRRGANLVLVARRAEKLDELHDTLVAQHPGPRGRRHRRGSRRARFRGGAGRRRSGPWPAPSMCWSTMQASVCIRSSSTRRPSANAAQIQLNCGTLVDLTARFLPAMVQRGHGVVINVASTAAFQPTPGMAVYGASKAFVLSFTEALWQECRGTGVRVLALCPGATETEFFARTGEEFLTDGRQTAQASREHGAWRVGQILSDRRFRAGRTHFWRPATGSCRGR